MRNLLFWHKIVRIAAGTIGSDRSAYIEILVEFGIAAIDLFIDNVVMLAGV
jgi:hypothetical protein